MSNNNFQKLAEKKIFTFDIEHINDYKMIVSKMFFFVSSVVLLKVILFFVKPKYFMQKI